MEDDPKLSKNKFIETVVARLVDIIPNCYPIVSDKFIKIKSSHTKLTLITIKIRSHSEFSVSVNGKFHFKESNESLVGLRANSFVNRTVAAFNKSNVGRTHAYINETQFKYDQALSIIAANRNCKIEPNLMLFQLVKESFDYKK